MDRKEIIKQKIVSIFVIFSGSIFAMYLYMLFAGTRSACIHFIPVMFALSLLIELSTSILYRLCLKKELSNKKMLVCMFIHMIVVILLVLSAEKFMEWVFEVYINSYIMIGMTIVIYSIIVLLGLHQNVKLTNMLNKKLTERYKESELPARTEDGDNRKRQAEWPMK
ncbi:MAG: DUF3021 domain-containing protein [Oscillospiraceae bacterium]|nr:DUF3021 domain-containing protein [Oscillospiraceae bacterium]